MISREKSIIEQIPEIFSRPPALPHSYQLQLASDIPSYETLEHVVFQTLGELLTHGILFLYGNQYHLSDSDIQLLTDYLASFGFSAVFQFQPFEHPERIPRALPYILKIPCNVDKTTYCHVIFYPLLKHGSSSAQS